MFITLYGKKYYKMKKKKFINQIVKIYDLNKIWHTNYATMLFCLVGAYSHCPIIYKLVCKQI